MTHIERIEFLQETHKHLDRQCTDLESKLAGCYNDEQHEELATLKKKKLQVKDQIEQLRKLQNEESLQQ
jgi:hypothetical protein